ncbi:membrane-spanning 4-domains subfamily A member 4D-like [Sphaeramia orbicularis]|uniref:Uncharacterized LOC115427470 n=1 Tax=Sphaeramia orbicularis TaxID=375764 RepID=A0A672YW50_9TELE|nr:membrane-spanning 4-domains subfamily A member 4D-like [Sphaeramia orbicularis]
MEDTGSTAEAKTTAEDGNLQMSDRLLKSTKPLHRFVRMEPRSLGIVILLFGCAEILMGFQLHLAGENRRTSLNIYSPFWQGVLFVVCGNLSIYTGLHPSKKMMTVSLSMYVVSLLGIIVSGVHRIVLLSLYQRIRRWNRSDWITVRMDLLYGIEGMLLTSSLCALVLLIFLIVVARMALKSTNENVQVIVQQSLPPGTPTAAN